MIERDEEYLDDIYDNINNNDNNFNNIENTNKLENSNISKKVIIIEILIFFFF